MLFLNTLFLKEVSYEIELISKYKYQSFKYTDYWMGQKLMLFFCSSRPKFDWVENAFALELCFTVVSFLVSFYVF